MIIRLLIPLLWLGFSGVLHANEVPPSHPMDTMSDAELEAVSDHDQSKEDAEENSPHTHGDHKSLVKNILLNSESKILNPIQSVTPKYPVNKP